MKKEKPVSNWIMLLPLAGLWLVAVVSVGVMFFGPEGSALRTGAGNEELVFYDKKSFIVAFSNRYSAGGAGNGITRTFAAPSRRASANSAAPPADDGFTIKPVPISSDNQ